MNCSQIYLGSDIRVAIIDGDNFSVEMISPQEPEHAFLVSALSKRYIYYLAPHTGCGCGWSVLGSGTENDEKSRMSVLALSEFLKKLESKHAFSLFSGNPGLESLVPESISSISVIEFSKSINKFLVLYNPTVFRIFDFGVQ